MIYRTGKISFGYSIDRQLAYLNDSVSRLQKMSHGRNWHYREEGIHGWETAFNPAQEKVVVHIF